MAPCLRPGRGPGADPHTVCARYRTLSPVVARITGGLWSGAAEIEALLKDDRVRSTKRKPPREGLYPRPLVGVLQLSMHVWDGPEHQAGEPFTRTFALRLIEQTRPMTAYWRIG